MRLVHPMPGGRFPMPLGGGRRTAAGDPTALMAVLNATPDSFSDGGELPDVEAVVARARAAVREGATILDVGGESTRPGAASVTTEEELRRVVPVLRALKERVEATLSIDTTKAAVFEEAWRAGATILNDVSALSADPDLGPAAARTDVAVVLMHRRGGPASMRSLAVYGDVVAEVAAELEAAVVRAEAAGIPPERLALDPGLGFAKSAEQSFRLLGELDRLRLGRFPLVVGPSRKSFLGEATGREAPKDRDAATAVVVAALARRGVECVRVHHVGFARDAVLVAAALAAGESAR